MLSWDHKGYDQQAQGQQTIFVGSKVTQRNLESAEERLSAIKAKTAQQLADINSELSKCGSNGNSNSGQFTCGGTGGWRRVVHRDMSDPQAICPLGWKFTLYGSLRTCGRVSKHGQVCDPTTFPVTGGAYTQVCGKVRAFQFGGSWGFHNSQHFADINKNYADGVILTHGIPRQHIWTFAAGGSEGNHKASWACPCDNSPNVKVPPFVGNDYFCESVINRKWKYSDYHIFHSSDALWDGKNCIATSTCCSQGNPPFFVKKLKVPTTDNIDARLCMYDKVSLSNFAVQEIELYVK